MLKAQRGAGENRAPHGVPEHIGRIVLRPAPEVCVPAYPRFSFRAAAARRVLVAALALSAAAPSFAADDGVWNYVAPSVAFNSHAMSTTPCATGCS